MAALTPGVAGRLHRAARSLVRFALPQRCPGCGGVAAPSEVLCAGCRARIPGLDTPLCARCSSEGRDPHGCARHPGHRVFAPWIYDERAAEVIHALKYGGRPAVGRPLGALLAAAVPAVWRTADLVLEVPLHRARLRERGYNQAGVLADELADVLGAPRVHGVLLRTRATAPQARLGEAARRANVARAFGVARTNWIAGRRALIVDDVMTTGATLDACLTALRAAGAEAAGVAVAWAA